MLTAKMEATSATHLITIPWNTGRTMIGPASRVKTPGLNPLKTPTVNTESYLHHIGSKACTHDQMPPLRDSSSLECAQDQTALSILMPMLPTFSSALAISASL